MIINSLVFPDEIKNAIKNERLVVFVGAGVSRGEPTCLPDFSELVYYISKNTQFKFNPKRDRHETFLGKMEHSQIRVREIAASLFTDRDAEPNNLHKTILKLFKDDSSIRIVTTNYDIAIEKSFTGETPLKVYNAPALPLGDDFQGIVHLHGNQNEPKNMILTDSDFGKAYLLEGYATRFLVKLFAEYTVLFIGYSYNDVVMTYLSRALPTNQLYKRFILTEDRTKEWELFGIEPIYYPSGAYALLTETVDLLGKRVNRNALDWKNKCESLSSAFPPMDPETTEEVLEILNNEIYLTFFFESFREEYFEEWFAWFVKKDVLNYIYSESRLNTTEDLLSFWLLKVDLSKYSFNNFLNLNLSKKITNKFFISKIFGVLSVNQDIIDDDTYKKLLTVFDYYINNQEKHFLRRILDICKKRQLVTSAFQIFRKLLFPVFFLDNQLYDLEGSVRYKGKYEFDVDAYLLKKIWEPFLSVNLETIYRQLFFEMINTFEMIESSYKDFNDTSSPTGFLTRFEDIETEIKKEDIDKVEIYICKIFYDVSLYMIRNEKIINCATSEDLVSIKSVTAQRILLLCLKNSENIKPNIKLKITKEYSFYDNNFKTELFRLIDAIYGELSKSAKSRVLKKITRKINKRPQSKNENYAVYNWFAWLNIRHGSDPLLKMEFNKLQKYFEGYSPRTWAELNIGPIESAWIRAVSPVSREQLDSMSPDKIATFLNGFKDHYPKVDTEVTSEGMLELVFEKANTDNQWRIEMIKYLIDTDNTSHKLWNYLLKDIGKASLSKIQFSYIIDNIISESLIKNHGIVISEFVNDIVLNKALSKNFFQDYEDQLLKIIGLLYDNPTHNIAKDESYIMLAINSPNANAVQAFLNLLMKRDENQGIPEKYKDYINKFIDSNNVESLYFIPFVIGNYRVLYLRDNVWTTDNILVYLNNKNEEIFQASWEGFLSFSPIIYQDISNSLIDIYKSAINNIDWLSDKTRHLFVDSYGVLIFHVVPNKIETFASILNVLGENDRIDLFNALKRMLSNLEKNAIEKMWDTWGIEFFDNISNNIPLVFSDKDLLSLFEWIKYSSSRFKEVVSTVVKLNPIVFDHPYDLSKLLTELKNLYNEPENFDAKASLLIYFLKCEFEPRYVLTELIEYYDSLISESNKDLIIEIALSKGIDFSKKH